MERENEVRASITMGEVPARRWKEVRASLFFAPMQRSVSGTRLLQAMRWKEDEKRQASVRHTRMPSCKPRTNQTDKQNRNTDKKTSKRNNKQGGHRDKAYTRSVHASLSQESKFMKSISLAVLVDC